MEMSLSSVFCRSISGQKDIVSMVIVRYPLERLVSGYYNKVFSETGDKHRKMATPIFQILLNRTVSKQFRRAPR